MKRHQPTIIDIARELGISKSTVSRALTGSTNIHPDTRQRILEAARRLEYQPNMLAQSLIRSETHLLGVVIPDIEKPFYARIVSGIQHMASQAGYRVIITQSNESPEVEVQNVQALVLSRADGLLVCHTRETTNFEHMRLIFRKGIPLVSFARICEELPITRVVEDDRAGGRIMTEHLLEQGYRRIAVLAGPKGLLMSEERIRGYCDALTSAGLPVDPTQIYHTRFTREEAQAVADDLMTRPAPPDALFAVYDAGAIDVLLRLNELGFRVPTDLAIAGFGDDPAASLVAPGLTTFRQSPYTMGQAACRAMLNLLAGPAPTVATRPIVIEGQLIVRRSTTISGNQNLMH